MSLNWQDIIRKLSRLIVAEPADHSLRKFLPPNVSCENIFSRRELRDSIRQYCRDNKKREPSSNTVDEIIQNLCDQNLISILVKDIYRFHVDVDRRLLEQEQFDQMHSPVKSSSPFVVPQAPRTPSPLRSGNVPNSFQKTPRHDAPGPSTRSPFAAHGPSTRSPFAAPEQVPNQFGKANFNFEAVKAQQAQLAFEAQQHLAAHSNDPIVNSAITSQITEHQARLENAMAREMADEVSQCGYRQDCSVQQNNVNHAAPPVQSGMGAQYQMQPVQQTMSDLDRARYTYMQARVIYDESERRLAALERRFAETNALNNDLLSARAELIMQQKYMLECIKEVDRILNGPPKKLFESLFSFSTGAALAGVVGILATTYFGFM
jgi:hypothetical protein